MTDIPDARRAQFTKWTKEFEGSYLLESRGQQHLASYAKERQVVLQTWADAKAARASGGDLTDLVLYRLLPYRNTRNNREKGFYVSVAPAITTDIKKWFENAGWQKAENWPAVAAAIYDLLFALVERDHWDALKKFETNETLSRGLRSGLISPTLHCLRPDLRIVNSKAIDTVNFLFNTRKIANDLGNYRSYLSIIDAVVDGLGIQLLEDRDVFDVFCHWMCDKQLGGYARLEKTEAFVDEGEEAAVVFDDELEPQNHWEAIYYIVKSGELLGYKTYVADPSRLALGKKLSDLATLKSVPVILKSAPQIEKIDAIWYKPTPPFYFFEVEDGGTMREALHRLYNSMAFDARFFVICPPHNRDKFDKWVTTQPFKEFEDRYQFRTYQELFAFYRTLSEYRNRHKRFLGG